MNLASNHGAIYKNLYGINKVLSPLNERGDPNDEVFVNRPRSVYQYSSTAPRLSGKNCKFFKFLLFLNSQKRLGYKENNTKYRIYKQYTFVVESSNSFIFLLIQLLTSATSNIYYSR